MTQPPINTAAIFPISGSPEEEGTTEEVSEKSAQERMNERNLRRAAMKLWGGMPITDVSVCIGMKDKNGQRTEVVHQIDGESDFRIVDCTHNVKEEMTPVRVEGKIEGFEPSGKYRLKLDCVYIKE